MGRFDHLQGAAPAGRSEAAPPGAAATAGGPSFDAAHYLEQARRAHERGAWEPALRLYGRALEEDRELVGAWRGQVRVLLDMGQAEEAATWMEQAGRVVGEVPGLLALRCLAAVARGQLDEARQWSDRAMRDGADQAEVWLARAAVVYASGNGAMARVNLDKGHEREPGATTGRRCGEVALQQGDLEAARRWLLRAEQADPDCALVALRQGVLHERRGDLPAAREHLERALRLEPRLTAARLALVDLEGRGPLARLGAALRKWRQA